METKDKSVGLRIDRQVYEQAMLFKEIGRNNGDISPAPCPAHGCGLQGNIHIVENYI